ncbi:MAG: glycosyltransferase [Dehalococcoidia bacterium]
MTTPARSAAGLADRYLPVSRARIGRAFVELAGIEFCRTHRICPLWREHGELVVATSRTTAAVALHELEQRLRQRVTVRPSGSGEIAIAIASALGEEAAPVDRRSALADVLMSMALVTAPVATAYALAAVDEPYLGASLVEAKLITEAERREALGIAFHLPGADIEARPPTPGLRALIGLLLAFPEDLAPLWIAGGDLFLGCLEPPATFTVRRIEDVLGLRVQPVLVAPGQLRALRPDPAPPRARAAVDVPHALLAAGLVNSTMVADARRVAAHTREPVGSVLQRLAGLSRDQIDVALAARSGLDQLLAGDVEARAAALLPAPMVRGLGALPARLEGRRVVVAMLDPWDEALRLGLAVVLGREVRPALISAGELATALAAVEAAATPPGAAERSVRLLLEASFLTFDQVRARDIAVGRPTPEVVDAMLEMLDEYQRADAIALDAGLPRVRHLVLHRDEAAAGVLEAHPGVTAGLPLWRDDDVVTVAVASPADAGMLPPRAGTLRCAIAAPSEIAAAEEAWAALEGEPPGDVELAFGRVLELRQGLRRVQVMDLFHRIHDRDALPMDMAVAELRAMTPAETCAAFAEILHTEPVSLRRGERLETESHAAATGLRRDLHDPVDHEIARMLTLEQSDELGALPFARVRGVLQVAMADPLSSPVIARLERLLHERFIPRPAWRAEIREAARRVYGTASVGELLLEQGLITTEQLTEALMSVEQTNVTLPEALLSLRTVSEEEIGERLAQQYGLPFFTIRGVDLDPAVTALLPEVLARERQMLPIALDAGGTVTVAMHDPSNEEAMEEARRIMGRPVRFTITTRTDIRDALERLYHLDYLEISAAGLRMASPENSAYKVVTRPQKVVLIGTLVALIALGIRWPIGTASAILTLATGFYICFSMYKFYLIIRSLSHDFEVEVTEAQMAALNDRDLPVYTILIPLYHESAVLPILTRSLERMDYPKEKLDVKLLLEEDDTETIAVARASRLPPYFDITIVPNGQPKGKPKACNYGLLHSRGEYAVIYDAEDVPDPDQLKRVLVAFYNSPDHVVCVQAKLSYYNRNQNVLTQWFTAEYALWFDLLLPGLDASGAPIPLGGTSNHFKLRALIDAGAWDPFNVTEDADLGLRIFKIGGSTAVVDSTTYEEANSVVDNWIRQRSRWVKGYIQTYLVHMRHPIDLWRSLGTGGFLSFQLVIGGTVFSFLFNPILWGVTALWFTTKWAVIQELFPPAVYYLGAISLYVGNFAFAYMNVAGCLRRRYYPLVKWALLSPVYWVLMSIAAWKGFLQLFYRPFYWEKTVHGLADKSSLEGLARLTERAERP